LGTIPDDLALNLYSHHTATDVGIFLLKSANVFSKGYILRNNTFVACNYNGLSIPSYKGLPETIRTIELGSLNEVRVDQAVHLINSGYDIYGHWLVDFLPKIFALKFKGFDFRRLKFLIPSDTPSFGIAWLKLLGLDESNFLHYDVQNDFVTVQELIVPTMMRSSSRACIGFAEASRFLLSCVAEQHQELFASGQFGSKLFVSRAKSGRDGRTLKNRPEIEKIAEDYGYELFYPEQVSILDQISAFNGAAVLVGEYGSAMHGSMFSKIGALVCCLRAPSIHPGFLQSGICEALQQPLGYIFGSGNLMAVQSTYEIREQDFKMGLEIIEKQIKISGQAALTLTEQVQST
jgi:hypothetical protein